MPNCHAIDSLVTPYVDDTLVEAERLLVDDHLCRCAPCQSRVVAERAARELVRGRAPQLCAERAPDALRAACADAARLQPSRDEPRASRDEAAAIVDTRRANIVDTRRAKASAERRPSWRSRLVPYALAASLVLIVGSAFLYQATDKSTTVMAAELAADHVKCFAMNGMLGTRHAPAAVESSMAAGFAWRMQLPADPARAGLELVGARPCLYGGGKVAHIMYRHNGRPVSVFMLPDSARAEQVVEILGHQAAVWCVDHRTFVLIARESRDEVQRLAAFVRSTLR